MGYLQRFISHLVFVKVIIHQSHYPWGSVLYMYRICKYMLISKQWRTNVFTDRKKSSKINCLIWFCKLPTHSAMARKSFNWQKLFWQIEKAEFHLRTRSKCMQRDVCILSLTKWSETHIWSENSDGFNSVFVFNFSIITENTQEAETRKAMSVIYLLANNFHCYNKY